jgi:hypothetical protein
MLTRSIVKLVAAAVLTTAAVSPTFARMTKMPDACAKPELRCTIPSSCDKDGWCNVYGCVGGKTVKLPFACNEKLGGCFQKHC